MEKITELPVKIKSSPGIISKKFPRKSNPTHENVQNENFEPQRASSQRKPIFRSENRNLEAREIINFRRREQKWYTQKNLKKVDVENS